MPGRWLLAAIGDRDAAFSATLRGETDLTRLSEQLVAVVQETMQPTHVSLWLSKPVRDNKRNDWVSYSQASPRLPSASPPHLRADIKSPTPPDTSPAPTDIS